MCRLSEKRRRLTRTAWPPAGQLQRFMAALTESVHTSCGRTVLYVPDEAPVSQNASTRDKACHPHHPLTR